MTKKIVSKQSSQPKLSNNTDSPTKMVIKDASGFSTISDLLKSCWTTFEQVWLKLLLIHLILSVVSGFFLIFFTILTGVFSFSLVAGMIGGEVSSTLIWSLAITILIWIVSSIVITLVTYVVRILVISSSNHVTTSIMQIFNQGLALVPKIFIVNVIIWFLAVGGSMVFVVPGMIIAFLLSFANWEIVVGGTGVRQSLSNSVAIVTQNFSKLAMRWLVAVGIWVISILTVGLISLIIPPAILVTPVLLTAITWYLLVYWTKVYLQAKNVTNFDKPQSMSWMYLISGVGWILMIIIFYFLVIILGRLLLLAGNVWSTLLQNAPIEEQALSIFEKYNFSLENNDLKFLDQIKKKLTYLTAFIKATPKLG